MLDFIKGIVKIVLKINMYFLLLSFFSCSSVPEKDYTLDYNKDDLINMSPLSRIFLDDFDKEYYTFNESDNFIPSEDLINKYPIIKIDNNFYIKGLIKIAELTDDIDLAGLIINTKAGNILTVNIPLNLFHDVIVKQNIKYLQIDEKVNKRR